MPISLLYLAIYIVCCDSYPPQIVAPYMEVANNGHPHNPDTTRYIICRESYAKPPPAHLPSNHPLGFQNAGTQAFEYSTKTVFGSVMPRDERGRWVPLPRTFARPLL